MRVDCLADHTTACGHEDFGRSRPEHERLTKNSPGSDIRMSARRAKFRSRLAEMPSADQIGSHCQTASKEAKHKRSRSRLFDDSQSPSAALADEPKAKKQKTNPTLVQNHDERLASKLAYCSLL